jgi:hypothetical protein
MMQSHKDLAEQYEYGARANKANPMPLRKRVSTHRGVASRLALQFSGAYSEFAKTQTAAEVPLAFDFPPRGGMALAPQMSKVSRGAVLADAELDSAQTVMIQRGVVQAVCRAVGAPGDPPKAKELWQKGKTSRGVFQAGMAELLYSASGVFGEMQANVPDTQDHILRQAAEALTTAAPEKPGELKKKIDDDQKKLAKRRKAS